MKNSMRLAFAALLLAAMSLSSAFAQETRSKHHMPDLRKKSRPATEMGPAPQFPTNVVTSPTLTFTGNVQICESAVAGAACHPAKANEPLPEGSHLMVGKDATAQLTYPNGAMVNFTEPGLYTVNAGKAVGIATSASSIVAANTGFITFAGLIAAAAVSSSTMGEDENLLVPLSGG